MSRRMTTAQKVAAAIDRHENATLELIRMAENWNSQVRGWDLDRQRKRMFEVARQYSKTLNRLTRVRG